MPLMNSRSQQSPLPLRHRRIALLTDKGTLQPGGAATVMLKYRTADITCIIGPNAAADEADDTNGVSRGVPSSDRIPPDTDAVYCCLSPDSHDSDETTIAVLRSAFETGVDVVAEKTELFRNFPVLRDFAERSTARLISLSDLSTEPPASGRRVREGCCVIQTISDGSGNSTCCLIAAAEIRSALRSADCRSNLVAASPVGTMISGRGVPADSIRSDRLNGAVEQVITESDDCDVLISEGGAGISHPALSALTLGLLHGAAPDGLIFCLDAGVLFAAGAPRERMAGIRHQLAALNILANLRHPCRFIAVAVLTENLTDQAARTAVRLIEKELELPVCDFQRGGAELAASACMALRTALQPSESESSAEARTDS